MASKIHTDNSKHHKYVTTNKQERKKNKLNIVFTHINNIYYTVYEVIDNWWNIHFRTTYSNPHPIFHNTKNYRIIYDDCNHKTFRVYDKKKHKFINTLDKNKEYGHLCLTPKHFKK